MKTAAWLLVPLLACGGDLGARLAARERSNPIATTPESLARGRALYAEHCERCHGTSGRGDGPDAASIEGGAGDLVERAAVLREGSIAWKIENGMNEMPAFGDTLSEDEIWVLTSYLRSLAGEEAGP